MRRAAMAAPPDDAPVEEFPAEDLPEFQLARAADRIPSLRIETVRAFRRDAVFYPGRFERVLLALGHGAAYSFVRHPTG